MVPSITRQPEGATVNPGSRVTFVVSAKGIKPLAFQWEKDGNIIEDERSNELTVQSVGEKDEGVYSVEISNVAGEVVSNPASLFVNNPPVIQVQPAEGIQLHYQTKTPDDDMRLRLTDLDFRYAREFSKKMPDAYQRLLLDVLNGDPGLFARSDEVDLAWSIIDPIVEAWAGPNAPPLDIYPKQLWGPESSTTWMRAQQRDWFDVCPVLQ